MAYPFIKSFAAAEISPAVYSFKLDQDVNVKLKKKVIGKLMYGRVCIMNVNIFFQY